MRRLLFLRGAYDVAFPRWLDEYDDMWVHLAAALGADQTEIWYLAESLPKHSAIEVKPGLTVRAVTGLEGNSFKPDVVFARGGLPWMAVAPRVFSDAFCVYYSAIRNRDIPPADSGWGLVFVDSPKSLQASRTIGFNTEMFIKPAADNVFLPAGPTDKKYDVIFVGNWPRTGTGMDKGHKFFFNNLKGYRGLQVGRFPEHWASKYGDVWSFAGRVSRWHLPMLYAKAKVAVIHCPGRDSCPRVLPEALACNCPVLITTDTRFWTDKYIVPQSGIVTSTDLFRDRLQRMMKVYERFTPRQHYQANLSIPVASEYIRKCCVSYGGWSDDSVPLRDSPAPS